jgi:hypothetical protein
MTRPSSERGVALIAALLVMMMMSAMLAGFMVMVNADQMAGGIERDQTQAYAAAHAGVEKLTADLGQLFSATFSPTGAQLNALATDGMQPDLPGIEYVRPDGGSGYRIMFEDTNPADGNPDVANPGGTPISAGPYQGLMGLITPYTIEVTSRTAGDAEVRMRRTMQTIAIPVFQFGVFSENNLSFHSNDFAFGGRVHTNANLYLAAVGSTTTTLADRVTAVQEVIRTHFTNGRTTSGASYTGNIRMAKAPNCPAAPTAINNTLCRNLAMNEGSLTGDVGSSANPNWVNLSVGTYNSYIRTGLTGARRLDLPLVDDNAEPIDIIRRPPTAPAVDPATLAEQRFYNMATLRILLSDTAAQLTALPDAVGTPVSLELAATPATAGTYPLAASTGSANDGYRSVADTPLLGGHILINRQAADGTWSDVTHEILGLGISGRNLSNGSLSAPDDWQHAQTTNAAHQHVNAIIRLQRVKDNSAASPNHCLMQVGRHYYWPNTLYDPREALRRDNADINGVNVFLGGVMHYIEFDVNNFRRWINGDIGTSGPGSMNITGYVVYFSDRRNNRNPAVGNESTGEFGWEDTINTNVNGDVNNVLNAGEDVNGNNVLDAYGRHPVHAVHRTGPRRIAAAWGSGSDATPARIDAQHAGQPRRRSVQPGGVLPPRAEDRQRRPWCAAVERAPRAHHRLREPGLRGRQLQRLRQLADRQLRLERVRPDRRCAPLGRDHCRRGDAAVEKLE